MVPTLFEYAVWAVANSLPTYRAPHAAEPTSVPEAVWTALLRAVTASQPEKLQVFLNLYSGAASVSAISLAFPSHLPLTHMQPLLGYSLKSLDLSHAHLEGLDLTKVFSAKHERFCGRLTSLSLAHAVCTWPGSGAPDVLAGCHLPALEVLDISYSSGLVLQPDNPLLSHLVGLNVDGLSGQTLPALAGLADSVRSLNLGYTRGRDLASQIARPGLEALIASLASTLTVLNLSGTLFSSGFGPLKTLGQCTGLTWLDLSDVAPVDSSAFAVERQILSEQWNHIVLPSLTSCSALVGLNLTKTPFTDSSGIAELAGHLPALTHLALVGTGIGRSALGHLASFPALSYVSLPLTMTAGWPADWQPGLDLPLGDLPEPGDGRRLVIPGADRTNLPAQAARLSLLRLHHRIWKTDRILLPPLTALRAPQPKVLARSLDRTTRSQLRSILLDLSASVVDPQVRQVTTEILTSLAFLSTEPLTVDQMRVSVAALATPGDDPVVAARLQTAVLAHLNNELCQEANVLAFVVAGGIEPLAALASAPDSHHRSVLPALANLAVYHPARPRILAKLSLSGLRPALSHELDLDLGPKKAAIRCIRELAGRRQPPSPAKTAAQESLLRSGLIDDLIELVLFDPNGPSPEVRSLWGLTAGVFSELAAGGSGRLLMERQILTALSVLISTPDLAVADDRVPPWMALATLVSLSANPQLARTIATHYLVPASLAHYMDKAADFDVELNVSAVFANLTADSPAAGALIGQQAGLETLFRVGLSSKHTAVRVNTLVSLVRTLRLPEASDSPVIARAMPLVSTLIARLSSRRPVASPPPLVDLDSEAERNLDEAIAATGVDGSASGGVLFLEEYLAVWALVQGAQSGQSLGSESQSLNNLIRSWPSAPTVAIPWDSNLRQLAATLFASSETEQRFGAYSFAALAREPALLPAIEAQVGSSRFQSKAESTRSSSIRSQCRAVVAALAAAGLPSPLAVPGSSSKGAGRPVVTLTPLTSFPAVSSPFSPQSGSGRNSPSTSTPLSPTEKLAPILTSPTVLPSVVRSSSLSRLPRPQVSSRSGSTSRGSPRSTPLLIRTSSASGLRNSSTPRSSSPLSPPATSPSGSSRRFGRPGSRGSSRPTSPFLVDTKPRSRSPSSRKHSVSSIDGQSSVGQLPRHRRTSSWTISPPSSPTDGDDTQLELPPAPWPCFTVSVDLEEKLLQERLVGSVALSGHDFVEWSSVALLRAWTLRGLRRAIQYGLADNADLLAFLDALVAAKDPIFDLRPAAAILRNSDVPKSVKTDFLQSLQRVY